MRTIWRAGFLSLLLAATLPAKGLVIAKGTAMDSEGNSVQISIKMEEGEPRIVDLDYAPVQVPSNHSEAFGTHTTYNGVDGYEYLDLNNQSETVTSHLRFFNLKREETGNGVGQMRGKVAWNESAILQWSGTTTFFTPSAGGQTIVSGSTTSPQTETKNYQTRDIANCELADSTKRQLSWIFYPDATAGTSASIIIVRIELNRMNLKKWRIRISTERQYFDLDYWPTLHTVARGFLRIR